MTATSALSDGILAYFTSADAREDPYPLFDELRASDPVHYSQSLRAWVLTRYDDAEALLRDRRAVRSALTSGADISYMYDEHGELWPVFQIDRAGNRWHDGPPHMRRRQLLTRVFNPRNIATWDDTMSGVAQARIAQLRERKEMDLMRDFAYELPLHMICEVFGLPHSHHAQYRQWTDALIPAFAPVVPADVLARGNAAATEYRAHMQEVIAFRRERPDGSLISELLEASREDPEAVAPEYIAGICITMMSAGHHTTGSVIGNTVLALVRNPEQLATLEEDLSLVPEAFEEGLRFEGALTVTQRFPTETLEISGTTIGRGETIHILLQAAGRDPAKFQDPHRYWIGRPEKRHLAFAMGPHFCIGASLARAEGQQILRALLENCRGLERTSETIEWQPGLGMRGLASLPVRWN